MRKISFIVYAIKTGLNYSSPDREIITFIKSLKSVVVEGDDNQPRII